MTTPASVIWYSTMSMACALPRILTTTSILRQAIDRHVAQAHDVVGEKRNGVMAEAHRVERLLDLDDGRLAEHGEVEGRGLAAGIGKYDLVRERRFPASRTAGDVNENSGRPPPRISSRPGTPVGSLRMGTRSCSRVRPSLMTKASVSIRQTTNRATRSAPGGA
jgi:hypothetical protein